MLQIFNISVSFRMMRAQDSNIINEALKKWKKYCGTMGIPINDKFLYTLLFADDQVVVAMGEQDSNYVIRKLREQYKNWG